MATTFHLEYSCMATFVYTLENSVLFLLFLLFYYLLFGATSLAPRFGYLNALCYCACTSIGVPMSPVYDYIWVNVFYFCDFCISISVLPFL